MDNRPIGFFDSGVGGLTIWRATRRLLPREQLVYLADSRQLPYGEKSVEELRGRAVAMVACLRALDTKLVVVACNTATVHAIDHLRATFPDLPLVGVAPVVKTLARRTRTGTIAVLATPATAHSPYLAGLIEQFAPTAEVITASCDGLAELVERGEIRGERTAALLERHLAAIRASRADVAGLACTHYPFLRRRIKQLLGPDVRLFDPSRPVARRVRQLLTGSDALAGHQSPAHRFYTTGDRRRFAAVAGSLLRDRSLAVEHLDL